MNTNIFLDLDNRVAFRALRSFVNIRVHSWLKFFLQDNIFTFSRCLTSFRARP